MEPKDEIPYGGDTTYPMRLIMDRYMNTPPHNETIKTEGKIELPEMFVKVLKKSIPDSVSIEVDSYSVHNTYNPMNFDVIPNYLIYLVIHYTWDANIIKSTDTLTEIVNTAFSMTYHDKTNMTFRVKNVVIPKRDYEREFFEFFVVKK